MCSHRVLASWTIPKDEPMPDPGRAPHTLESPARDAMTTRRRRRLSVHVRSAIGLASRLALLLGIILALSGSLQSASSVALATHTGSTPTQLPYSQAQYPPPTQSPYTQYPPGSGQYVPPQTNPWNGTVPPTPTPFDYRQYQPAENQTGYPGTPTQQYPGAPNQPQYPGSSTQPYPGAPIETYPGMPDQQSGIPGQQSVPSPPYVGAPSGGAGTGSGSLPGAIVLSSASPAAGGADPCYGDELITYSPETPRIGNELLIAVTSAHPHPYGRLAGTERTTFVRERAGQRGYVWEWTVQPSYPGQHEYIFYVDSTVPCQQIQLRVLQSLATRTPTPTKTPRPYNWSSSSNDNGNNNGNDNNFDNNVSNTSFVYAPVIDPAGYVTPGQDIYDCSTFQSQSQAQRVLRYDPSDPNRLDSEDGFVDGIACTTFTYSAYPNDRDFTIVTGTSTTPGGTFDPNRYLGQGDRYGCLDFASHANAQAVLRADPSDPNRLDTNPRDGLACGGPEAAQDGVAGGFMPPPFDSMRVPRP